MIPLAMFDLKIDSTELLNAGLIAIGFGLVITTAEYWRRRFNPPAEWTRKLVHVGGGGLCLLLPLLIDSFWIVMLLAMGMCGLFVVSKQRGWLNSIHGIRRASHGAEFYPIVILLLFVLSGDQYWQYVICVLVLAVSDSAAALIGTRYGKFKFTVEHEKKSVEGSLAFFAVTFLVVLLPLLAGRPMAGNVADSGDWLTRYLLTATLLGLLVTCMEIVSLHGTDNLWVPLGTWLVLTKTFQTDVVDLAIQNISFLILVVGMLIASRTSELLNVGGTLVCCLAAYGLWAMGSLDWAMVFFVSFAFYLVTAWAARTPWQIRVRAAAYSLIPPLLVMAIANLCLNKDLPEVYRALFGPFLAASCVSLGQACANAASWPYRKNLFAREITAVAVTVVMSTTVCIVAMVRQQCRDLENLVFLCLLSAGLVAASVRLLPTLPPGDAPIRWLQIRSLLSGIAALAMFALQWLGWVSHWAPG